MASSTPSTTTTRSSPRARSRPNTPTTFSRPNIGFHRKSSMMNQVDTSVALEVSHRASKTRRLRLGNPLHLPMQGVHGVTSAVTSAAGAVARATPSQLAKPLQLPVQGIQGIASVASSAATTVARVTPNPLSHIHHRRRESRSVLVAEDVVSASSPAKAAKATKCACSVNGEHFKETALECVVPGSPERVYKLMFRNPEFLQTFLKDDQKLLDIELKDWELKDGNDTRAFSYIKPLSGSIGPKQTTCQLVDQVVHCDFDDHITILTTTRTPDVPSGDVFSVVTKTCLTWASAAATRICVTTETAWTGRSFVKGIINSSCISGQKEYHSALENAMRSHIEERKDAFLEGLDASAAEVIEIPSETSATTGATAKSRFIFNPSVNPAVIALLLLVLLLLTWNYRTFATLHKRTHAFPAGAPNVSHDGLHGENAHAMFIAIQGKTTQLTATL